MKLVILGLSLSSSWGNGHATTYRALIRALSARGHDVLFLERDVPWYAARRDMAEPDFCRLALYDDLDDLKRFAVDVAAADAVVVGSFTPQGVEVGRWARSLASGPLAFYDIDTPVTLSKLARGEEDYLAKGQIAGYDVYFSFTGGPTLDHLEQAFGSPAARALYCSADADLYHPTEAPLRWDLAYLGTYSEDRQPLLERLLLDPARRAPQLRFAVAGPQYPDAIDWPANVERIEHVAPDEHAAFYASARFTLNVTRADMAAAGFSPSVRLFEAAACGAPIISDVWEGLDAVFAPGVEILTASDADDVLAALTLDEPSRKAIGEAARGRFLAEHTPDRRAETLERELAAVTRRKAVAPYPRPAAIASGKTRHALVAGGGGFLGSHLCDRLLEAGWRVTGLDNLLTGSLGNLAGALSDRRFDFIRADVVEPLEERFGDRRFDRIYNLACAASPPLYQADPEHTLMTSVVGTKRLLDLAHAHGARFLQASTSEVYGDPEVHPQPETYWGHVNATGPRACYDEGKRCAETLVFDYIRAGRGEARVARIFNTYGPRMSAADGRVVSTMISQALAGEDLTVFGDGAQTRSFCFVDDLIRGLVALMEHDGTQAGPVNLGNPAETTVGELAELIIRLTESSSRVTSKTLPVDDPKRRRPDITLARDLLGWAPEVGLEAGVRATIAWFRGASDDATPVPAGMA
jgi:nucleoside-diphosphate-sugar epimerase